MGMADAEEKVVVLVRLRPLNEIEIARNDVSDWDCVNDDTIIFRNNPSVPERTVFPTAHTFDRVFGSDCSTKQVYEEGAKEVALSVVSGFNSSIFAYGQTSSGKTYTMSGVTEYALADIYDYMERHKEKEFVLKFSAMEIYNESVRDLLSVDNTPLRLLDDPERGTIVEKVTEETLRDWSHLKELLSLCESQRLIGETTLNETSSRSHQIIRLTIESSTREFLGNDSSSTLTATLNFVDLAGSERASQSLSAGTRLKEGCHINRSLLTLGTVIRKLSKGRGGHVPFRDSKLTRILQSSLGGNSRTAIICTLSPARSHVEQSRNTLLFGSCAKEVTTNAQVNIIMSDKALVKHLQRELARLESELQCCGPNSIKSDSAALLRERELQIEELTEEVADLTLQRDRAQSQVEDLLQLLRDTRRSMTWACCDHNCPKLQVRKAWDYEDSVSDSAFLYGDVKKSGTFKHSEGHSGSGSNEQYPQLPMLKDNLMLNSTSRQMLISGTGFVRGNPCGNEEEIEEQSNEYSDDLCKEVQCIEIKNSSVNRLADSSSHEENTEGLASTAAWNGERADKEFVSSCILSSCFIRSPEELTPRVLAAELPSSQNSKLTRSRSCEACLMTSLSSPLLECVGKNEHTPTDGFEKDFPGRPKGFQIKLPALNYGSGVERLLSKDTQTSVHGDEVIELKSKDVKICIDEDITNNNGFVRGEENMTELQCNKQHVDFLVQETELKVETSANNVKDIGLDPIQHDLENISTWPTKFKRLQKEIIKLWDACNVSLVHRTFFFLLFKGDLTDSIYMEVELRRLSFLNDKFSQGNQTVEDGRTVTLALRTKVLRREREMLSKQMKKRLSAKDRESLYLKWGLGLNTKHRKLKLAYLLWTETEDMDHIAESAAIVVKLVGSIKPGQALKEMFGLNFMPQCTWRKFNGWKSRVMSPL
ncbi:kinesin-like protein KIN-7E isoform X2 [Malania oleifera]|uniref:kinesin-like protein KIN-7E isoform X2 n=1 Tax=Malania oleifera TaxID=397392 RepID=UPI0025AE771D|nr:kinesin-like protein KIN-7E isoform X2 [Malania oleifera]